MPPLIALVIAAALSEPIATAASARERPLEADTSVLTIMTYNIRYDNPADGVHSWSRRRAEVVDFLRSRAPDILCIQEALHSQVSDLQQGLGRYAYRGVGRDDGNTSGEYSALFFDAGRFICLEANTVWLSPTPAFPSTGWDAALPRIVSWVRLSDTLTGKTFTVFNTHFDHAGPEARAKSATMLRSLVHEHAAGGPAVVAGDFNCQDNELPYSILVRTDGLRPLRDARTVSSAAPAGPLGTFSGFSPNDSIDGPRIDYIFVTEDVSVQSYETLLARRPNGFLSDHLPVLVTLTLPSSDETKPRP